MSKIYIVSWNGTSISGGVERVVKYVGDVFSGRYEVVIVSDLLLQECGVWKHFLVENRVLKAVGFSLYVLFHKRKGDCTVSNGFQAPFIRSDYLWTHGNILEYRRAVENRNYYKASRESIMESIGAHLARNVICVADHVKKEYADLYHIPPRKMQVLLNPVDCSLFYPIAERLESSGTITVLYIGRLVAGKGVKELLQLSSYIETHPGYRLMIVTQSEKEKTRPFLNKRSTEVYTKVAPEQLNAYYNQADVFYLPSSYEGYELVTLESLSAGVPVVGYRVGAIRELAKRKQHGICILHDKTIETALMQLTKMALKYRDKEKRYRLHEEIKLDYGMNVFSNNLQSIIG